MVKVKSKSIILNFTERFLFLKKHNFKIQAL